MEEVKQHKDLWSYGALQTTLFTGITGFLGIYWDMSWHIDYGRDSFWIPPHVFVYTSILLAFAAGIYTLICDRRPSRFHLKIWRFQVQYGALISLIGVILIIGMAPLDDAWHRLIGIDESMWGPMHLILFFGFCVVNFGGIIASYLERIEATTKKRKNLFTVSLILFSLGLLGWLILVLAEFEFPLPKYPTLFYPIFLSSLPLFPLIIVTRLAKIKFAATITIFLYIIARLSVILWYAIARNIHLAGYDHPNIPILVLTSLVIDVCIIKKIHPFIIGVLAGSATLLSNFVFFNYNVYIYDSFQSFIPIALVSLILSGFVAWGGAKLCNYITV